MKSVAILLIIPFIGLAQPKEEFVFPTDSAGRIVYKEVIETSLSKKELYRNLRLFHATFMVNSEANIVYEDSAAGVIILKHKMLVITEYGVYKPSPSGFNKWEMKIRFKDGKYQYEMKDFFHEDKTAEFNLPLEKLTKKRWPYSRALIKSTHQDMEKFITVFKSYMGKTDAEKNDF